MSMNPSVPVWYMYISYHIRVSFISSLIRPCRKIEILEVQQQMDTDRYSFLVYLQGIDSDPFPMVAIPRDITAYSVF
jgi:hypothetical protein